MSSNTQSYDYGFNERRVDTSEWADEHGVHECLIPFDLRTYDPIRALIAIRREIEEAHPASFTITTSNVDDRIDGKITSRIDSDSVMPLFEICGSWPLPEQFSRSKFVNPEYIHLHDIDDEYTVSDTDSRKEIVYRCGKLGCVRIKDLAARFGYQKPRLAREVSYRHDIPYRELKSDGMDRFRRTLCLLDEWGYSREELATAFDLSVSTVGVYIREVQPSFEVPDDPTA